MGKIGFGIIGYGSRGISYNNLILEEFREKTRLVAYCDSSEVKRTAAKKSLAGHGCKMIGDLDKFLQLPEIDVVIVATPQHTHADLAVASLSAGKHVLLEKPMARTVEECDRILEARDHSGKELFIGFNLRSDVTCKKIKELIAAGEIGRPQTISCTDFYSHGYTYFRRWHRFNKNSGGLLVEKGCHSLDLINWFMDSTPIAVGAFGGLDIYKPREDAAQRCRDCNLSGDCPLFVGHSPEEIARYALDPENYDLCVYNSEKDTHDNSVVIVEYANGCRASYVESFASRVRKKSGRQFVVNGPRGQIWAWIRDKKIVLYKMHRWPSEEGEEIRFDFPEILGGHGGADAEQMQYVIDCLSGRCENKLTGEIGRLAILVAEAAETATQERRIVDISQGCIE